MAHTNVQIDKSWDVRDHWTRTKLEAELEFWRNRAERLQRELENIPQAIEEYGFIDVPKPGGGAYHLSVAPETE